MTKRQPDNVTEYTAKFSGHETFPLRYGWLYKAAKSVRYNPSRSEGDRPVTSSNKEDIEKAVVRMGVGKNMVSSIRYWSTNAQIICVENEKDRLTDIGGLIFGEDSDVDGNDPYLEKIGSVWLLHWLLNSNCKEVSASRWFFNRFNGQRFDKQQLLDSIIVDIDKLDLKAAEKTVSKDIECLLQGYTQKSSAGSKISEDSFSSPLVELGLIRTLEDGKYRKYSADLGDQESLPTEVFTFALIDYWKRKVKEEKAKGLHQSKNIPFDTLLIGEGSPARIFRLSQNALANRLDEVEELTGHKISWTDTQGLRQIHCDNINRIDETDYLVKFYEKQGM